MPPPPPILIFQIKGGVYVVAKQNTEKHHSLILVKNYFSPIFIFLNLFFNSTPLSPIHVTQCHLDSTYKNQYYKTFFRTYSVFLLPQYSYYCHFLKNKFNDIKVTCPRKVEWKDALSQDKVDGIVDTETDGNNVE